MTQVKLGSAGFIEVDTEALRAMPLVEAYIFNYGLKQMLNDVHSAEKDADKKIALANKKLDSLMRGEVAQARTNSAYTPLERKMRELAEADLKVKLAKIGKKPKDVKSIMAELVTKLVASREEAYRTAAEKILAVTVDPEEGDADDILAMLEEGDDSDEPEDEEESDAE